MQPTLSLREYQREAIAFALSRPRAAIWADPGLGKTLIALSVLQARILSGSVRRALIIAPLLPATTVWPEQARLWSMGFMPAYLGDMDNQVNVLNYDRITKSTDWDYDMVIVDEARRLKSYRTKQGGVRTRALGKHLANVPFILELTGTPASNGLLDLWGQIWFLDHGQRLGITYSAFSNRWFSLQYNRTLAPTPTAATEIATRLRDLCLPISARDNLDVPDVVETTIEVVLPQDVAANYRQLERQCLTEIAAETHTALSAASKTSKLLQLAAGGIYTHDEATALITGWQDVHDAKLDALEALVEEYGHPLLVAYWWRFDLLKLKKRFPGGCELTAHTLPIFNRGEIPILFVHPASAGHGISLHGACRAVCFYSDWWDNEMHAQVIERVGPARQAQIGRRDPVLVYTIVARNTIDAVVQARHKSKQAVQQALIEYVATLGHQ